ncbi:MAG: triphosphoribosyl-dephospho-CoA synthase CitG [Tissierellia bacterium]|nr:triphosphoribosyl-dephospho-CoA synthase CitG [Tissierellia bacterium]
MDTNIFNDISKIAEKALIYEVMATPKPGLVDRNNSGAHSDMDVYSFVNSAIVLRDYFYEFTKSGYDNCSSDYRDILASIREKGIEAEKQMLIATSGVNTHKGIIFSIGILCAAVGSLISENRIVDMESITMRASEISEGVSGELDAEKDSEGLTYGEKLYNEHGIRGIRGEVESGFSSIKKGAYLVFSESIDLDEYSIDQILGQSLLYLMKTVGDSNVYGRQGLSALEYVKRSAEKALDLGGYFTENGLEFIEWLDSEFIERNISPGGCADLLAVIYFIHSIEKWYVEYTERLCMDILDSREERAKLQRELIGEYNQPVISFTLNIPGIRKNSNRYAKVHRLGVQLILDSINEEEILYSDYKELETGNEFYLVAEVDPIELKIMTSEIENMHILGRIFDIDVIDTDYKSISRTEIGLEKRKCIVCGNEAYGCVRSKAHSLEEVLEVIDEKIDSYIK